MTQAGEIRAKDSCRETKAALQKAEARVNELEQRLLQVESRTEDLETRLQRAEKERSDYIGTLSHELRNPLAAIVLGITLLKSFDPDSEQAHRAFEIIQRQTAYLSRIIDEMLDVARLSSGRVELKKERVELVPLIQRTLEETRSAFVDKDITLHTRFPSAPIWLEADPMRMGQVFVNLLDNAAKFTAAGGTVRVTVRRTPAASRKTAAGQAAGKTAGHTAGQAGGKAAGHAAGHVAGHVVISIEDSGVGIGPDILATVFNPLVQADTSLTRGQSGLGLGLPLVKGIVELHGGQVEGHSEGPDKGSCFTVRLPIEAAAETPKPRPRRKITR